MDSRLEKRPSLLGKVTRLATPGSIRHRSGGHRAASARTRLEVEARRFKNWRPH